jgi:DNA-directed RNA polymerase subunit M/transcription elongation factor TFIIS
MEFCKQCGKPMEIENGIGKCKCGFTMPLILESEQHQKQKPKKAEGFVHDKNELATFPHKCKKCGHEQAQVIEPGVGFGDEGGVIRYRCGKCNYTEQDKDSNT